MFVFLLIGRFAYAQTAPQPIINATFSSTVRDAVSHAPIVGATVQREGVIHSQQTDHHGRFRFVRGQKLPATAIRKAHSPSKPVSSNNIDALDEMVIIGYGNRATTEHPSAYAVSVHSTTLIRFPGCWTKLLPASQHAGFFVRSRFNNFFIH